MDILKTEIKNDRDTKQYKFNKFKYKMRYILPESMNFDNLVNLDKILTLKDGFSYLCPLYKYNEYISCPLRIKTPFVDFSLYQQYGKTFIKTNIIENKLGYISSLLDKYNNHMESIIFEKFPSFTNASTSMLVDNLIFKLNTKSGKVMTQIIKYNISKKYDKVEHIKLQVNNIKDFINRLDKDKYPKQMRIVFSLMTWISNDMNCYGTKLIANFVEIKYKDQKVKSILDNNEIKIHDNELRRNDITPISISV